MSNRRWQRGAMAGVALLVAGVGCGGGDSSGPDTETVAEFITAFRTAAGGATGTYNAASAPASGSGPAVVVDLLGEVIVGGTVQASVTSAVPFSRLVASIEGVLGYYDLTLPAATTATTVLLSFAQDPPRDAFNTRYAAAAAGGAVGSYTDVPVSTRTVGTGEIQVSVSWDAASDVDLHVIDPAQDEIYYGEDTSPSGGRLDLDSNAGCALDHVNNENITWEGRTPPRGQYIVRLDYFSSCGVAQTKYVVTVNVRGRAPQVFTGTFNGQGTFGGAGAGIPITTFTY